MESHIRLLCSWTVTHCPLASRVWEIGFGTQLWAPTYGWHHMVRGDSGPGCDPSHIMTGAVWPGGFRALQWYRSKANCTTADMIGGGLLAKLAYHLFGCRLWSSAGILIRGELYYEWLIWSGLLAELAYHLFDWGALGPSTLAGISIAYKLYYRWYDRGC